PRSPRTRRRTSACPCRVPTSRSTTATELRRGEEEDDRDREHRDHDHQDAVEPALVATDGVVDAGEGRSGPAHQNAHSGNLPSSCLCPPPPLCLPTQLSAAPPNSLTQRTAKNVLPPVYGRAVLDALFPLVCPGCGRPGAPVCERCAELLRPAPPGPPPSGVDAWCAPFAYEGAARELVARVKYRGTRAAVPWLAPAMGAALDLAAPGVAPVPWAPHGAPRRRQRGFDPAELLARAVARRLRARRLGVLDRRPGPPQTGLDATARRRGPQFEPRTAVPTSVLLVDDVATTGATLAAAASA